MTDAAVLHRLATGRFSCRAFLPDPVPEDVITDIIATARNTPSWCNAQPWQVSVTAPPATDRFRAALKDHMASGATSGDGPDLPWPQNYPGIYGDRRRACGLQLYEAVGVKKGDRAASQAQMEQNFRLFGAPHVAILHSPADLGPYGALDCGGFVMAFCLAAQAHGVATIPQAALALHAGFVKTWMGIDQDRMMLCGISFGRADDSHPANSFRTPRATPDAIIDWHRA